MPYNWQDKTLQQSNATAPGSANKYSWQEKTAPSIEPKPSTVNPAGPSSSLAEKIAGGMNNAVGKVSKGIYDVSSKVDWDKAKKFVDSLPDKTVEYELSKKGIDVNKYQSPKEVLDAIKGGKKSAGQNASTVSYYIDSIPNLSDYEKRRLYGYGLTGDEWTAEDEAWFQKRQSNRNEDLVSKDSVPGKALTAVQNFGPTKTVGKMIDRSKVSFTNVYGGQEPVEALDTGNAVTNFIADLIPYATPAGAAGGSGSLMGLSTKAGLKAEQLAAKKLPDALNKTVSKAISAGAGGAAAMAPFTAVELATKDMPAGDAGKRIATDIALGAGLGVAGYGVVKGVQKGFNKLNNKVEDVIGDSVFETVENVAPVSPKVIRDAGYTVSPPKQINIGIGQQLKYMLPEGRDALKRQGIGLKQQPNATAPEVINLPDNVRVKPGTLEGSYKLKPEFTGKYSIVDKPRGAPFSESETVKALEPVYETKLPQSASIIKQQAVFNVPALKGKFSSTKPMKEKPILQQLEQNRLRNEQVANRIKNSYKPDWIKNMETQMKKNIIQGKKDVINLMKQYNNYDDFVGAYLSKLPYTDEMKQVLKKNNFMKDVFDKVNPQTGKPLTGAMGEAAAAVEKLGHKDVIKQTADDLVKNSDQWKDKYPFLLQRETWDRNIVDIAGKEDGPKIKKYLFEPIHNNEAQSTRYKNIWRDKIKSLNLTKKERELTQRFGEGKITQEDLLNTNLVSDESAKKIQNAVNVFREFYDDALNKANEVLVRNGYKPVPKLPNYFPHFEGEDPIMKALGIRIDLVDLPTDINGLTHQFKPGKNWFGNFQKRTGDKTTFDAVEGFDRYIEGISRVIHHTDDIQRLRGFSRTLRTKYSPPEISTQIQKIIDSDLPKELKNSVIDDLIGRETTHLSNAVADLDEFTNVLAGKKDLADRAMERVLGRGAYNLAAFFENRIATNMVAINPASWLTNFIPITQSLASTDKMSALRALNDTMRNIVKDDGFIDKSTFLTNRVRSDILSKGMVEKTGDVLSAPFKWIDQFTSQVVARSKYYEGLKKGLNPQDAMSRADEWTAKVIGDRSLGSMPTVFNHHNPLTRLFTQFQLEVNNQLSHIFKDLPREYLKNGAITGNIARLSSALGQVAVYSYIYNNIYEKLVGRRPAIDPIGIAFDFKDDLSNPNIRKSEAFSRLGKNAVRQLPFVGGVIGGGRIPIDAVTKPLFVDAPSDALKAFTGEGEWSDAGKDLFNAGVYVIPPFGGGQIKKTAEGLDPFKHPVPGVYNETKDGKELKFPVDPSMGNKVKSAVFGKYSTKEARDYYKNNRRELGAKQTEAFEKLVTEQGVDQGKLYDAFILNRELDSLGRKIKEAYNSKNLSEEAKLNNIKDLILRKYNSINNDKNLTPEKKETMLKLLGEKIKTIKLEAEE